MSDRIDTKEAVLTKLKIGLLTVLSEEFILDGEVRFIEDYANRTIRAQITGYLWGEDAYSTTISYPLNWWQAFKDRWFTRRMLARWPVIWTDVMISTKAVYPGFIPSIPDRKYALVQHQNVKHGKHDGEV